jgi:general secretion pathway protein G
MMGNDSLKPAVDVRGGLSNGTALNGPAPMAARWPRASRGFTLMELLIVVSLIMILAAIGLAGYRNSVVAAREAVLKEDLFRLRDAIDQHYADKGEYPASLDDLVSVGYLREIPVDPFTRTQNSWQIILAEPDPNNPTAIIGVYDVKSGSGETALDGSKYADW